MGWEREANAPDIHRVQRSPCHGPQNPILVHVMRTAPSTSSPLSLTNICLPKTAVSLLLPLFLVQMSQLTARKKKKKKKTVTRPKQFEWLK